MSDISERSEQTGKAAALRHADELGVPGSNPEPAGRDWAWRTGLLWVLLSGVGVLLVHALYVRSLLHGYAVDDAYITFRYAQNLLRGFGLTFNPGDAPIEGYSNFLWLMLAAPALRWGLDPATWTQFFGVSSAIATLVLVVYALRRLFAVRAWQASGFAIWILAASGYFASWSISGLETNMFALLLLAAWIRFVLEVQSPRSRWPISALLLSVIALLRPEGVFIAVGAVVARWLCIPFGWGPARPFRSAAIFTAIILAVVGIYEAWRMLYFGPYLLPNSVRAKIGGGFSQFIAGMHYVRRFLLVPYLPLLLAFLLVGRRIRRLEFASGVGVSLGYLLFVAAVGGDWSYGRMFVPMLPVAVVTAVGIVASMPRRASVRLPRLAHVGSLVLATAYVAYTYQVTSTEREARRWREWWRIDSERIAMGKEFAEMMPSDTVVAVYAAGQIPYFSGLRAHDMLGLNDRHIAEQDMPNMGSGVPGHEKWNARYTLEVVRPDIIVEGRLIPGLVDHPIRRREYQPIRGLIEHQDLLIHRSLLEKLRREGRVPAGRPLE